MLKFYDIFHMQIIIQNTNATDKITMKRLLFIYVPIHKELRKKIEKNYKIQRSKD